MSNALELRVKRINSTYKVKKQAIIQFIATPITPTAEGFVPGMSTVDFVGCAGPNGLAIAFDAKETENKTSFPLNNIKPHQIVYLDYFDMCGGMAFFLVHFKKVHKDKAYVLPITVLNEFTNKPGQRKSLPLSFFKDEWLVPIDDYLPYAILIWKDSTTALHS